MHLPIFSALAEPETPEQLSAALQAICLDAGLEHFLVVRLGGQQLDDVLQVFENAPAGAGDVKSLRHWSIGRLLDRMRKVGPPVVFGEGAEPGLEIPGYTSGVAYLLREARGGTVFYLGSSAPALPVPMMPAVQTLLLAAHQSIGGIARLNVQSSPLSEKELLCLQHFLNSLSAKETAQAMKVTRKTVEHHLASARKRLGVKTTSAAAYRAFDRGWITLNIGGSATVAS